MVHISEFGRMAQVDAAFSHGRLTQMKMLVVFLTFVSAEQQVSSVDLFILTGNAVYPPLFSIVGHP
jgi:hypothetical protein